MPPAVPLVAAAAGAYATSAAVFGATLLGSTLAATVANAAFGFVVSSAINQIGSRALGSKPKSQSLGNEGSGRTILIRSSVESHKIIYGTARVAGPLVYAQTVNSGTDNNGTVASGPNKVLNLIVCVAGHEVDAISTIYFNDQPLTLDANGWVTNTPYMQSATTTTVGLGTPRTITSIVRDGNNTVTVTTATAHGLVEGGNVTINAVSAEDPIFSELNGIARVVLIPSSTVFVFEQKGAGNGAAPLIVNPTATPNGVSTTVTTNTSYARIVKILGTTTQAATPIDAVPEWTANHRLRGIAYLHVKLIYSPDVFALGLPNISCVVKGKKVYDPRTATSYWTDNAALCIRDYLASDYGFNCIPAEINDTYAIAAANICDEAVTLKSGGTQKRYTCNGVVDTATAPLENLQSLVTSIAGAITYVQGAFRIHAAAYDSPSGSIGIDDLAGGVQLEARPSRKQLFNAVKGTYVDPGRNWQPTDFPHVTNATYETQDNGERITSDIELAFTNHPEAAQRIAKIILEKGRQGIKVTIPLNHSAVKYAAMDVVLFTNPQLGFAAKPFRVLRWNMAIPGAITLTLQEESAASYDWNNGEATLIDPAPDTNLPNPLLVAAPAALTVTESLYVTRLGDGVKTKADLTWGESKDAFLVDYQPEYRKSPATEWIKLIRTANTSISIEDIEPSGYDFRVKAFNRLGVSSSYATASRQMTGLLAPPATLQNLTISTIGGLAILRWDQSTDLDVRIGGKIVFRHSPTTTDTWTASTTIGNAIAGSMTLAILPLKPGVYLAKAVDSSGIEATTESSVTTTQATALAYANVASITEHATFTGTKTNCIVSAGVLKIDAGGRFDDIVSFDAVPNLDSLGGIFSTATYLFSGGIDLTTIKSVRLTSHLKATIDNQLSLLDDRTDAMDDWLSFDGILSASADARVYVRQTNDNPAGSPTWGAWHRLDSGEFTARAFQFKCELEIHDPAYNILISELSVTVDGVV